MDLNDLQYGITTIDCEYLKPKFAASYLMSEGEESLFIENNTAHAVPRLLAALREKSFRPEDVRYLIITHVHLDHAGGTSMLMKACPNATLLAHPRAATHMIDPSKLVASAKKVYGEQEFARMYGEIGAIDASRVRSIEDGEVVPFGRRNLRFIHTRGHANHHFCIYDDFSRSIFTGDAFGLRYPALQGHGLFIFPSTSPTDFDPGEARLSLRKIIETGAERAYLTHFGDVEDLKEARRQLEEHLDFSEILMNEAIHSSVPDGELVSYCESRLRDYFAGVLKTRNLDTLAGIWDLLKLDLELNAAGIAHVAHVARRRREKA